MKMLVRKVIVWADSFRNDVVFATDNSRIKRCLSNSIYLATSVPNRSNGNVKTNLNFELFICWKFKVRI
jgi:hypothetical protein